MGGEVLVPGCEVVWAVSVFLAFRRWRWVEDDTNESCLSLLMGIYYYITAHSKFSLILCL